LNIKYLQNVTEESIQIYYDMLRERMRSERMTHVEFTRSNSFFRTDPGLGIKVCNMNKYLSGAFCMRLPLPIASQQSHESRHQHRLELVGLKPRRLVRFEYNDHGRYAYAPVGATDVLCLSVTQKQNEEGFF